MIDIHCHILPGLDDGAPDIDTSILMAEIGAESGVTDIIATPHTNQAGRFENYASPGTDAVFSALCDEIASREIPVRLHPGMEVYGSGMVPEMLRDGKLVTLAGSRYFLIEFGFRDDPDRMERILDGLLEAGVVPVVAHPERYELIQDHPNRLFRWASRGILLQSNKGSFTGFFGRKPRELAFAMVARGLTAFVASDAHGYEHRTPALDGVEEILTLEFSGETAKRLLYDNPMKVLRDEPVVYGYIRPFR